MHKVKVLIRMKSIYNPLILRPRIWYYKILTLSYSVLCHINLLLKLAFSYLFTFFFVLLVGFKRKVTFTSHIPYHTIQDL